MILTLLRRAESATRPDEELWSVRVGRVEGERGASTDLVPASLLSPEIDAAQPYSFEEFRARSEEHFSPARREETRAPEVWTTLPLPLRHARGELD
jgi:hypothetical protein